jgi:cytochrome b561
MAESMLRNTSSTWGAVSRFFHWTLALLVLVHIASAVYHWLWKKDDVMQRMLR